MTPAIIESKLRSLVADHALYNKIPLARFPAIAVGVRAYYRDSMGRRGANDFGIYDDSIHLLPAKQGLHSYQANVDPSLDGWNFTLEKPFAHLTEGLWYFISGLHKGNHPAWRQPDPEEAATCQLPPNYSTRGNASPIPRGHFRVLRNPGSAGSKPYLEDGYHAINIHRGGTTGTSSWGCQTIPPATYDDWITKSYAATAQQKSHALRILPYILLLGPIN